MYDTKFKPRAGRPRRTSPEMAAYARQIAADNSREHSRLKRNLIRAIREELTDRQRRVLVMYYARDMTLAQIGKELNVRPSTVSRTLHRGEERLRRCLRYGAQDYLMSVGEEV